MGCANGGVIMSVLGVGIDYDECWLIMVVDVGRGNYEFLVIGGVFGGFLYWEFE